MENATLLRTITELPSDAHDNTNDLTPVHRQISVEREARLADDFAFISATTHDPTRVMAACIEEGLDRRSAIVRLASNTGDIQAIVERMQSIVDVMSNARQAGMGELSRRFLHAS